MSENNPFPGENNTGHYWDGNLRELTNEPPRWWMIFFWVSIAAWIIYGILYPMWPTGVGEKGYTQGVLGWTSIKEYKEGLEQVEKVRAPYEEKLKGKSAAEILADKELTDYTLRSAKVLFGDNCAACHGNGGQGNPGFPVLADDDWLFGGSIEKDRRIHHRRSPEHHAGHGRYAVDRQRSQRTRLGHCQRGTHIHRTIHREGLYCLPWPRR